jgi:hypothetical protein
MNMDGSSLGASFKFTDSRQVRIHERLGRLVGPGAAAFFLDACRLMEESKPFQSTTHLVAHLLREIESALRDVLEPVSRWPERKEDKKAKSSESHRAEILCVLEVLEIPEDDAIAQAWLGLADKANDGTLHRRAHRSSLALPRPLDQTFRKFWESTQTIFDYVLGRLESSFSVYRVELDKLIAKEVPDSKDIERLLGYLPNSLITRQYFFDKLRSSQWVRPLRESGVFYEIAEPIPVEGGISCPPWPPGGYLDRSLSAVPEEIAQFLEDAPMTGNWRAIHQMTGLALQLPVTATAKWAQKVELWIEREQFLSVGLPERFGLLLTSLAERGDLKAALTLARALLAVVPARVRADDDDPPISNSLEPRVRMDLWNYEQIIAQAVPLLVQVGDLGALLLFSDLLDQALTLSDRRGVRIQPEDHSQIWRSAIEEHPQNFMSSGVKAELVKAVRDAAEMSVQLDPARMSQVVETLEDKGRSWKVFRRIALHLLRVASDVPLELVRPRLLDRSAFESADTNHEYVLLEKQRFAVLAEADRAIIFGWIEGGPLKAEETLSAWAEYTKQPTNDEIRAEYYAEWRINKLASIVDLLDENWKQEYAALTSTLGKPEHPEFTRYTRNASFGVHSPITSEELSALTVEELVRYLAAWAPGDDPVRGASPEGLGRNLRAVVARNPERYATAAAQFKEIAEPTYIRAIVEGMQGALQEGHSFSWGPIVDLCAWATGKDREIPGRSAEHYIMQADQDWGGARASIARLLNGGLTSRTNKTPFELRRQVWQAIEPITADPNPTWERLTVDDGEDDLDFSAKAMRTHHLLSSAINSVRGSAIEAVVRYASWVRSETQTDGLPTDDSKFGFAEMPEVQRVLERHLDATVDGSPIIRAQYGEYFSQLEYLDDAWVAAHIPGIFPQDNPLLRQAAWDAYLSLNVPSSALFAQLRALYAETIEQLDPDNEVRSMESNPESPIARHLMVLYWGGSIVLEDDLLGSFYAKAGSAMRGRAFNYVGWTLRNWKGSLPEDVAARLKKLMEWRLRNNQADRQDARQEFKEFGWWFVSEKFDDVWSITMLQRVLDLTGLAWPAHLVVERLAKLATTMPLASVRALKSLVDGVAERWEIDGWIEPAKDILRAAINSTDVPTKRGAQDLCNILESRGHLGLLDLLKELPAAVS